MRKVEFINNEFYHIYNRGVDKREVFLDKNDFLRFLQSMEEFNTPGVIGSIYKNSFLKSQNQLSCLAPKLNQDKLVDIICFCLNSNHYHLILKQISDKGIEKFMHKIGGGYTNFFNKKHSRTGSLFQGTFKAIHVNTNEYLLYLNAYVNLNNKVHGVASDYMSSWEEYISKKDGICIKDIILNQYANIETYKICAEELAVNIKKRRNMEKMLLESFT